MGWRGLPMSPEKTIRRELPLALVPTRMLAEPRIWPASWKVAVRFDAISIALPYSAPPTKRAQASSTS